MKFQMMLAAALLGAAAAAQAQVKVEDAWVRPSVQGQTSSGGYMKLTSPKEVTLVAVSSPAAGTAEVHEMKMEGDVMRMLPMERLRLPAGKTVELKPGGLHVMLMDLKAPLRKDSSIPLRLVFRDEAGRESRMEIVVPVLVAAPGGAGSAQVHKH
jgi:copper(I)-binding protein